MEIINKFPADMDVRTEYKLLKSSDIKAMKDAADSILPVNAWVHYLDDGKEVLALETTDGEVFATISKVFIPEFLTLVDVFGADLDEIKVFSKTSRAGRSFISCTIA